MSDSYPTSGSSPGLFHPHRFASSPRPLRVAVLGYGTVGSAVAGRLAGGRIPGLALTQIFDRRAAAKQAAMPSVRWTSRIDVVNLLDTTGVPLERRQTAAVRVHETLAEAV